MACVPLACGMIGCGMKEEEEEEEEHKNNNHLPVLLSYFFRH
jgi:hypothetical protein